MKQYLSPVVGGAVALGLAYILYSRVEFFHKYPEIAAALGAVIGFLLVKKLKGFALGMIVTGGAFALIGLINRVTGQMLYLSPKAETAKV